MTYDEFLNDDGVKAMREKYYPALVTA